MFIQPNASIIYIDELQPNSQWEITRTHVTTDDSGYKRILDLSLYIRRKSSYMVMFVMVPMFMLAILNLSVFILPCDSGEKASYAITVFLSFMVFLTVVNSYLPANAEHLSIFSTYIVLLAGQSTTITVLALVLIRLRQFDSPVPNALRCLISASNCKVCAKWKRHAPPAENVTPVNTIRTQALDKQVQTNEGNSKKEDVCDWRRVVNTLDRLLFIVFALFTVISSFCILLYVKLNKFSE